MRSIYVVLLLAVLFSGCIPFTGPNGQEYSLEKDRGGYYLSKSSILAVQPTFLLEENLTLISDVKGSIYEGGETVSVFGTCLTQDDAPYPNSSAVISVWYPNGTVLFQDTSMQEIQPAYFVYIAPMDVVGGTYLTEMECRVSGSNLTSLSFGEWQNPAWVSRIGNTEAIAQNLTITLNDLSVEVTNGFELTFDYLNQTNSTLTQLVNYTQNLSQEIYLVGQIANGSVDRNDSYLAQLIQNITSIVTPANESGLVNWTERTSALVYWHTWDIRVNAYDPNDLNQKLTFPDVQCSISTSLSPGVNIMEDVGNYFVYEEFINSANDFNWNVSCSYT